MAANVFIKLLLADGFGYIVMGMYVLIDVVLLDDLLIRTSHRHP